ncbi:LAGLIDADG family homing endonuclease [Priestia aryabhattai]|uniref:LAGLIDADG family homing endonuclease n=1 Tax=Priestia aryabhattai TaxID=412384 RepID=UPI003D2B01CD
MQELSLNVDFSKEISHSCVKINKKRSCYKNKWERGVELDERLPHLSPFLAGIITGFVMGEGSFYLKIGKSKTCKSGYQLTPGFKINLKKQDCKILEDFRFIMNCGRVNYHRNSVTYCVEKMEDIFEVIIPFFDKYPLRNIKEQDFQYFKIISYKILKGEGKTLEGIKKILTIRDVMNNGGGVNRKSVAQIIKRRKFDEHKL